jgi:TolB-like protein
MKRCPECRRDYYDETLLYCLDDGNALLEGPATVRSSDDEPATAILSEPPASAGGQFDEPQTAILHSTDVPGEAPTRAQIHTTEQTAVLPSGIADVPKSKSFDKRLLLVPVALALIVLGGFLAYQYFSSSSSNQINSIAVMPFENRNSDADTDYLSDGLAASLIFRLTQIPDLRVSPTSSVMRYKGKETDVAKIASELGVDAVMTGRLTKRGDNLNITVELVDARNNKSLWGEQYERKLSELLTTQREIVAEIVGKLQLKLSGESEQRLAKRYTDNPEAYQLYLRGRYEWNKFSADGFNKSILLFERAIEIDPTFALAYSGMADSYVNLGVDHVSPIDTMPKARVAAMQAIALDPSLAEAYTSLGSYKLFFEWDTAGADEAYRKAISLDPTYANARHFFSHSLQFSGKETEAIEEMKKAVELEPLSLVNNAELGWAYYLANQNDAAIEQLQKTIAIEPNFGYSYYVLGLAYAAKGNYAGAMTAFRDGQKLSPGWIELEAAIAYTHALAGDRDEARRSLAKVLGGASERYLNPVHIAAVYSALGDKDQAIEWLERGYRGKNSWMKWIAIEPQLERLRTDPRFQDLVRRVGR